MILRIQVTRYTTKGVEEVMGFDVPSPIGDNKVVTRRAKDFIEQAIDHLFLHAETDTVQLTYVKE